MTVTRAPGADPRPERDCDARAQVMVRESADAFFRAAGRERQVVGIELNASHLRSVRDGHLTATATPLRVGRTVQVWSIAVTDDAERAICAARCTLAVLGGTGGATGAVAGPEASG